MEAAHGARRHVPVPRDPDAVRARLEPLGLRPAGRRRTTSPYAAWRAQLERAPPPARAAAPPAREVPLGLDHPYWIDDPDFDLDFHVRHTAVPPPGSDDQLAAIVGTPRRAAAGPRRPLWVSYVIEGLRRRPLRGADDGPPRRGRRRVGRGAADADARRRARRGDERRRPTARGGRSACPRTGEMLARRARGLVAQARHGRCCSAPAPPASSAAPRATRRWWRRPTRSAAACGGRSGPCSTSGASARGARLAGPAPQRPRRPARRSTPRSARTALAFRSAPLPTVKDIKNGLGATVNDVVMAVCAGGLRTWLEKHDALPDGPLVALDPGLGAHRRGGGAVDQPGVGIFAALPVDEPDPLDAGPARPRRHGRGKQLFDAVPAETLTDFAQFPPPAVFALAMRAGARLRPRLRLRRSTSSSRTCRAPAPLYAAGARLLHYYPVSTIVDGPGPQRDRAELPRHARLRPRRRPRARARRRRPPEGDPRRDRRVGAPGRGAVLIGGRTGRVSDSPGAAPRQAGPNAASTTALAASP